MPNPDLEGSLLKIKEHNDENEFFDLGNGEIDDNDLEFLIEALEKNEHITKLDLSSNSIGNQGMPLLARLSHLTSLNLRYNTIGPEGLSKFKSNQLELLDIGGNIIQDQGIRYLLENCPSLKEVSLCECDISNDAAKMVLRCNRLISVNLSTNQLDDDAVTELTENSTIKILNLSQNNITKKGAMLIAQCGSLEELDLSSNYLGDEGAFAFSDNKTLSALNLGQNFITTEGFSSIIGSNTKIKELGLVINNIDLSTLEQLPADGGSIEILNLSYNHIVDRSEQALKALCSISSLQELNLSHNQITDVGATLLHGYRRETLKKLNLNYNPIEDLELIKEGFKQKRRKVEQ